MSKKYFSAGSLAVLVLLAGCASERVVLLPSADGHHSALVVSDAKGKVVLDQPYAASVRRGDSNQSYQASAAEVTARFADALAAQPMRPSNYMLYFEPGGNVLTAASQADLLKIRSEITQRAAAEIMVIGHTDRVGDSKSNDVLSKQRADAMRAMLIEAGIPAVRLEAVGRGEREPLVPTADDVAEPKNRRVEINLR
jgi:outer membrane protein OmpA-like peptidoglycan-associated protein